MSYHSNKSYYTSEPRNRRLMRFGPKTSENRRFSGRKLRRNQTYNNSEISRCLGIFGLNSVTTRQTLYDVFSTFGLIEHIQMVNFNNSFVSRGFCFIYFKNLRDARISKRACNNMVIDGRRIRADYSFTKRAHTPTPGVYMGRPYRSIKENRLRKSRDSYSNRRHRSRPSSLQRCIE